MNRHQFRWLEKTQVQLATVAALLFMYFVAWRWVQGADGLNSVVFLAVGNCGSVVAFAAAVLLIAVFCGVVTVGSRPQGAMLAAALGAGGISLRSGQMRFLLWSHSGVGGALFGKLILEVLALAVLAAIAIIVIGIVRGFIASVNERWFRRGSPLLGAGLGAGAGEKLADGDRLLTGGVMRKTLRQDCFWPLSLLIGMGGKGTETENHTPAPAPRRKGNWAIAARCIGSMAIGMIIAIMLLVVLLRSAQRGQILFALVASFAIAVIIMHQLSPMPYSIIAWMMPVLTGAVLYACAWWTLAHGEVVDWTAVPLYARVLPVDWMTAGGGGALLGFWTSDRVHELRHIERQSSKS